MNKNKIDKIYDYKSLFEGQTYTLSTVQTFCEFDETSLTFIDVSFCMITLINYEVGEVRLFGHEATVNEQ